MRLGTTRTTIGGAIIAFSMLSIMSTASSQNLVGNGNFENGVTGWTNVRFNDPLGTHGVRTAQTLPNVNSNALFGDFKTLTPVMENRYDSDPFTAQAQTYPVTFDCMWEKLVTTPIPSASVNRIEFIVRDATTNTVVKSYVVRVPGQTGLLERASLTSTITFPTTGNYIAQVFQRHSNLANMPYIAHIDNIVIGTPGGGLVASGSPSPGGTVDLDLDSPGDNGLTYVMGTSLGTGPIPIGQRRLNLSPDDLLVVTTANLLPQIFQNYTGVLDTNGKAKAKINIPNDNRLRGVRLHSAYVVLDQGAPFGIKTISNTASFSIS